MVRRRSTVRFGKGARRSQACWRVEPQTSFALRDNPGGSFGASGYHLPMAEEVRGAWTMVPLLRSELTAVAAGQLYGKQAPDAKRRSSQI